MNITCELCEKNRATSLDYLNDLRGWKFTCSDTNCGGEKNFYWIDLERIKPEDGWVKHLSGKNWFSKNQDSFESRRFRVLWESERSLRKFDFALQNMQSINNKAHILKLIKELMMIVEKWEV